MKSHKSAVLFILTSIFILGCSCCGITFPFLQGVPTPTSIPFFTSIPATQTQPSVDQIQIIFMADRTNINSGECALLQWAVQGPAQIIMLGTEPIPPMGQKQVCPQTTTPYILIAALGTPQLSKQSQVIINVSAPTQTSTVTLTPTKPAPIIVATATKTKTKTLTPTVTETSPPPPPGGGYWGPTGTDVALLGVQPGSPTGATKIEVYIKNNGPKPFNGTITINCTGNYYSPSQPSSVIPIISVNDVNIGLEVGQDLWIKTSMVVYPESYIYPGIGCQIVVPDDPAPENNGGTTHIP